MERISQHTPVALCCLQSMSLLAKHNAEMGLNLQPIACGESIGYKKDDATYCFCNYLPTIGGCFFFALSDVYA